MQKEELKTLVKKYFNLTENNTSENNAEIKAESFDSAELVDGTKITNKESDEFAVGQTLYVITEAGEEVTAPSGEHTTKSGIVIVVDGEGKITGYHRPGETGQGSLTEQEMSSEEVSDKEVKSDSIEEEKTELADHDRAEITVGDEPIRAAEEVAIEAIMESVGPEIEALKAKLADMEVKFAEYDEKLKEHMSAPAEAPVQAKERLSATLTKKDQAWKKEPFNQKQAQYDMVLKAVASNTKTK